MDLYYAPYAGTGRAVLMTAKALGVELNKKVINTREGEQLTPEFIKINPQHTIPTLVDNGFSIWESRAILAYLVEKYGKDDSLYPKEPKARAIVNQRLYFDMGTLNQALGDYFYPQFMKKAPADPELFKKVESVLDFLNTFVDGQLYVAGDKLTIADISIFATLSTFVEAKLDLSKYANVSRWYENAKKVTPGREENDKGIQALKDFLEKLSKQ